MLRPHLGLHSPTSRVRTPTFSGFHPIGPDAPTHLDSAARSFGSILGCPGSVFFSAAVPTRVRRSKTEEKPLARTIPHAIGVGYVPLLFSHLHFALCNFCHSFWCAQCSGWGVEAPRGSIFLAFVYVSGGGLVPQQGSVRRLFRWGHVPQEQVFACQGFFVVPKPEQGISNIPSGVEHHLGAWGLGYRALFVVPGRAHIARTGIPPERRWPMPGVNFRGVVPRWTKVSRFNSAGLIFSL